MKMKKINLTMRSQFKQSSQKLIKFKLTNK
jgi:hypothetical protein